MQIPEYYTSKKWINRDNCSLNEALYDRIEYIKRNLKNMSLKEKQKLWESEPYYEISKLIIESDDFIIPGSKMFTSLK